MKKVIILLNFTFLLFLSQSVMAQIAGSAHDFSDAATYTWNPSGEICIVCHTPHNADISVAEAPLWNHTVTTANYTGLVYTSTTFDADGAGTTGTGFLPDASSKLCLSCHDGSVAVDDFGGNATPTVNIGTINANALLDVNLTDDHPVSFNYAAAITNGDTELRAVDVASGNGMTPNDILYAGQVQCASCHDVHNGGSGTASLLVTSNSQSALCLVCHVK